MTHEEYAAHCEELFAVGGFTKVRKLANPAWWNSDPIRCSTGG
ncbi:hypothetical protein QF032_007541 [Streptomyces achromogenes]|nr:hypothetical protein [Streptomyces achromogenes]